MPPDPVAPPRFEREVTQLPDGRRQTFYSVPPAYSVLTVKRTAPPAPPASPQK